MKVVALVGPSGSGKTTTLKYLKDYGYQIQEEGYLDVVPINISNKSVLSKWFWIRSWLHKIWIAKQNNISLIITDRIPLEAIPYAVEGSSLLDPLLITINELRQYDIIVSSVYLRVPFEVCFNRSVDRIKREPIREQYGETELFYAKAIYDFYEKGIDQLWDFTIEACVSSPKAIADSVVTLINNKIIT